MDFILKLTELYAAFAVFTGLYACVQEAYSLLLSAANSEATNADVHCSQVLLLQQLTLYNLHVYTLVHAALLYAASVPASACTMHCSLHAKHGTNEKSKLTLLLSVLMLLLLCCTG
jgi:hypothetical protein